MTHTPSIHAQYLEWLARELCAFVERSHNEHYREELARWIEIVRGGAEYIEELKNSKLLLEKLNMELGEKAIALAKDDAAKTAQVTTLTQQLADAQKNQLPAGSVAISQAGADALNGAVGDDGAIPPTPVTPPGDTLAGGQQA